VGPRPPSRELPKFVAKRRAVDVVSWRPMARRVADKVAKITLWIFLCALGVGGGVLWLLRQPCSAPDRPRGVPPGSHWAGGCDGGNWFELLGAVEPGRYQLRIYHDPLGEVAEEGWFEVTSDCPHKPPPREELLGRIRFFDGKRVHLAADGERSCSLEKAN
jgi:hypothetical protein